jgi:hypothetical protein
MPHELYSLMDVFRFVPDKVRYKGAASAQAAAVHKPGLLRPTQVVAPAPRSPKTRPTAALQTLSWAPYQPWRPPSRSA